MTPARFNECLERLHWSTERWQGYSAAMKVSPKPTALAWFRFR